MINIIKFIATSLLGIVTMAAVVGATILLDTIFNLNPELFFVVGGITLVAITWGYVLGSLILIGFEEWQRKRRTKKQYAELLAAKSEGIY